MLLLSLWWLLGARPSNAQIENNLEGVQANSTVDKQRLDESIFLAAGADPDLETGFPVQTVHMEGAYMSGPAIHTLVGNIDADPTLEILVSGTAQGPLYAYKADGTLQTGFPVTITNRTHYPALGNFSSQSPGLEIFTGQFVYRYSQDPPGPIAAFDGSGNLLPGWPKDSGNDIVGPALTVDIDDDGLDEIFIHELDYQFTPSGHRYGWHGYKADGSALPGWPVYIADRTLPAVTNLDQDDDLELVTCDSDGADHNGFGYYTVIGFHHDGNRYQGLNFPFYSGDWCKLTVGDVDGDKQPEIIFIDDIYNYSSGPRTYVNILSATGELEQHIPLDTLTSSNTPISGVSPVRTVALGDMTGDGTPEIVVSYLGGLSVIRGNGTILQGFPLVWSDNLHTGPTNAAPVIGDVDGDGNPDILTINAVDSSLISEIRVYDRSGNLNSHFPKRLPLDSAAVPAIADIDQDGRNEIIITSAFWDGTQKFFDKVWVYDLHGAPTGSIEWGQLGNTPHHWNTYFQPTSVAGVDVYLNPRKLIFINTNQENISILVPYGNMGLTRATGVTITATLDDRLDYLGSNSSIPAIISEKTIQWNYPGLSYPFERGLLLQLQARNDWVTGDVFTVNLNISVAEDDFDSSNDSRTIEIRVVESVFLPALMN